MSPWWAADTVLDSAEAGAVAEGARRTREGRGRSQRTVTSCRTQTSCRPICWSLNIVIAYVSKANHFKKKGCGGLTGSKRFGFPLCHIRVIIQSQSIFPIAEFVFFLFFDVVNCANIRRPNAHIM